MKVILIDNSKLTEQQMDAVFRLAHAIAIFGEKCCFCGRLLSELENPMDIIVAGEGEDACRECYVKFVGPVIE